ncbi:DUF397 domain-containing protein [Streptomyces sp. NPDC049879]|uniref:DUF397 domain-containing protein n=1 Tax=Streptomyces sp. NPDC049879 TaxID=3365598 RepID=UPI0037AB263E
MGTDFDTRTAEWHTSSYTNTTGGSCVEVARNIPGIHPVRDTKDRAGHVLTFTTPAWASFLQRLK